MDDSNWERQQLRWEYGSLYPTILKLFFRYDPIGINFDTNTDEYEPEVDTVLPRLQEAISQNDLMRILHEEFCRWFGKNTAGAIDNYRSLARVVWKAYWEWTGS